MRSYVKLIWEQVVRYTLLDVLTAAVLCVGIYLLTALICAVAGIGQPYETYAVQSIRVLSLVYLVSLMATSAYWHIRLVRLFAKMRGNRHPPAGIEDAHGDATQAGEAKIKC